LRVQCQKPNMLQINNLSYRIGSRLLLSDTTAAVARGHRVGLVGINGSGKTTLLRLIVGQLEPDSGSVSVPERWRIGVTQQEAPEGAQTVLNCVLAADKELQSLQREVDHSTDPERIVRVHERLAEKQASSAPARAARILAGLGFQENAQQRQLDEFSGGWRMRVMLASLLFTEPELLLLDEPTNHLDLEAGIWLEDYLRKYNGTVLIVSHDRSLLNRVVDEILHLDDEKLTLYRGNYDKFESTRRAHLEQNKRMREKQDAQRAHIQKFVDKFRYKATKARQAQSRLKMLARMEPIPEQASGRSVTFDFPNLDPPLAPPLYSISEGSAGYNGCAVLEKLNLRIDDDDRIALIGANGNGKSTLLRLLAGRLELLTGRLVTAPKLRVGYFAQHQSEELDSTATPLVELSRKREADSEETLRAHLGRFGFDKQRADTLVGNLSGGEKARLLFALMTCDKPHILLLDEPTNHLDLDSRQALIQAINGFSGAVVIVSHDPLVLDLTTDRFWQVANESVSIFDGDLEDYRIQLLESGKVRPRNTERSKSRKNNKQEGRRQGAAQRRQEAPLRKQIARIEKNMKKLEEQKDEIEAELAKPELYEGDPKLLIELQKDIGWVSQKLLESEEAWLSIQQQLESAILATTTGDEEP